MNNLIIPLFLKRGRTIDQNAQLQQVLKKLAAIVKKAAEGDAEATSLVVLIVGDPLNTQLLQAVQLQAPELYNAMLEISENQNNTLSMKNGGKLEYIHMLRCGGAMKKGKKKAQGGEMEKTEEKAPRKRYLTPAPAKVEKAKCGCHLKKVGGVLVQVDCNGNIIK